MQRFRGLTRALGLTAGLSFPVTDHWRGKLAEALVFELDYGRPQLWLGYIFLLGAALYFYLPVNIPVVFLVATAVLPGLFACSLHRRLIPFSAALLALFFVIGSLAAQWQVQRVVAPRISEPTKAVMLEGTVSDIERPEKRPRAIIKVSKIEGWEPGRLPHSVRLAGVNLRSLHAGDHVKLEARLRPIPGPTHPGSYDPSFHAYFDQLGGTGTAAKLPVLLDEKPLNLVGDLSANISRWRENVTARIRAALPGTTGGIAASLITGDRAALTEELYSSFNGSGLMHVLSISGLHMILVAGGMFFAARFLFSLFSAFVFELLSKKLAAIAALVIVTLYEIMSGGAVATTRSYIMILIVFGSLLIDRPALSMRNVVLAAVLIAAITPHEITSASFQMSFAATAALIAAHERKFFPKIKAWDETFLAKTLAWGVTIFIASILTSFIAEIATAPFTLHHFHRISVFGIVGNVLALFFIELAIMPGVLLTLLALPFGLENWTLPLLGWGVDGMVYVARLVAGFPAALTGVSGYGLATLLLCSFAIAWACFWRSRLAILAVIPYCAGLALGAYEKPPDLYISAFGSSIAARAGDNRLTFLHSPREKFNARRWLENDGDRRDIDDSDLKLAQRCDGLGCTVETKDAGLLTISYDRAGLEEDCARADLLILPRFNAPPHCPRPKLIIDRKQIRAAGGMSVKFSKDWNGDTAYLIRSIAQECGARPWCAAPEVKQARALPSSKPPTTNSEDQ